MFWFNPFLYPRFPHDLDVPPTIYSLMQSLVNYNKTNKTKIRNLAKESHEMFFDFDYPLSSNVNKEDFETNILNHFIKRRIGSDTFTSFQIDLCSKLNEIMPKYNIMFDSLAGWNLFSDGLTIEKTGKVTDVKSDVGEVFSNTTTENSFNSETKMRHSDLPQSELQDLDNEDYVNIYEKNNGTNSGSAESNNQTNDTRNQNSTNNYNETIKQSQTDLVTQYIQFQNSVNSIYTLIYKDLECIFYQIY